MRRDNDLHIALRAGRLKRERMDKLPANMKVAPKRRNGVGMTPAPYRNSPRLQEVIIRAYFGQKGTNWAEHGKYLSREGAQKDNERGLGFDSDRDDLDIADTLNTWNKAGDERFFKFIISPEHGADLDLKANARQTVRAMEKDMGTRLQWVAIDHYNTDNPHVHLSVRGVDEKGKELFIDRHYLTQGIRQRAKEVATRQLGLRTEQDLDRSRERLIDAERFTTIDRAILRRAKENVVTYENRISESPRAQDLRLQEMGRLQTLAAMGLAEKTGTKTWQLSPDTETALRQLQRSKDVIKTQAHEHVQNKQRQFVGRVDEIERTRGRT